MSLNIPVIVSNAGGLPELIIDGVHGLVFPKGDVKALTKCIIMVLSNKETDKIKKLGIENKKWVSQNFNSKKMARLTVNLYKSLLLGESFDEKVS